MQSAEKLTFRIRRAVNSGLFRIEGADGGAKLLLSSHFGPNFPKNTQPGRHQLCLKGAALSTPGSGAEHSGEHSG